MTWPLSMAGETGVIVAVRVGSTVTIAVAQKFAPGIPVLLSVTRTEKEAFEVSGPVR
jgi:hypothetical protein